jgi:uncharacterized damage-inducible protein DinB
MTITRPEESEYASFYAGYVGKIGDDGPLSALENQIASFEKIRALPEDTGNHRYADGKWTVKELLGHMADTERVFAYRLLRIARADKNPLAGFEENEWAAVAPHGRRSLTQVAGELIAVRRATIALVESLDETAIANTGLANNHSVTGRAICWMIPGHAQHHLGILTERYGVKI